MLRAMRYGVMVLVAALLCGASTSVSAQDVRADLFKEANAAMEKAKAANAELLSPTNFKKAMEYYSEAEKDLAKGENLSDIRETLTEATKYFSAAADATGLAKVTFPEPMEGREKAVEADASRYAPQTWQKAEAMFAEAAAALEDGDVNEAKEKGAKAASIYRDAELEAIKANYLNETNRLIEQADGLNVADYAPKTLKQAKDLAAQADKELTNNRYDSDYPRSLALQARYEAAHAIQLSKAIKSAKDADKTPEDLRLEAEKPLATIASAAGMEAKFDEGVEKPTQAIVQQIQAYKDSLKALAEQRQAVAQYKHELEGIASERSELKKSLGVLEERRKTFAALEQMFLPQEGQVLRDGENVVVRLVGLTFDVGKSVIKPEHFGLLTKVQKAIDMYPGSKVNIQGHTDSHGSDAANLKLSQERADAVQAYLLANMNMDASRMSAIGYGETMPVANNETADGRTANRRIDVVITPAETGQ